jgi:hypothetical protein
VARKLADPEKVVVLENVSDFDSHSDCLKRRDCDALGDGDFDTDARGVAADV